MKKQPYTFGKQSSYIYLNIIGHLHSLLKFVVYVLIVKEIDGNK